MAEQRRMQRVVQGLDAINQLLDDGWLVDSLTIHSQTYERYLLGTRVDDGVLQWTVAVLSRLAATENTGGE